MPSPGYFNLDGRVALVTGAGTGIGKADSLALAKDGYAVVLAGRRPEKLEETAREAGNAKTLSVPTDVSDPGWEYLTGLPAALQNDGGGTKPEIAAFRGALTEGDNRLKQRFHEDEPVERLVRDRARLVDTLLKAAWAQHLGQYVRELALIAVGGYGRGELNLCSDIDIMVLLPKSETAPPRARTSPETVRSSVVLPAPFAPIRATISPGSIRSETPSRTWTSP